MTNLITPRALFSPTYLLNLVKPELTPSDPSPPKTQSSNQTRSKSDDPPPRYRHLNFSRCRLRRHLGFGETGNSAIRSADLDNNTVEPNMKWIGPPIAEIWLFEISPIWAKWESRSVVGRSVCPQYILLLTLISYTPLRYVRNVACEE